MNATMDHIGMYTFSELQSDKFTWQKQTPG